MRMFKIQDSDVEDVTEPVDLIVGKIRGFDDRCALKVDAYVTATCVGARFGRLLDFYLSYS
jgi:hypothetical protein